MAEVKKRSLGVYVHWPFCKKKCPYCDFNSHVREEIDQKAWLDSFRQEIFSYKDRIGGRPVHSIYFGGGTPSLMAPYVVEGVLEAINDVWCVDSGCEITLEANPTSSEADKFKAFRAVGINRLSVGVQAFNDKDLTFLGREHYVLEAPHVIDLARDIFPRYSFDLIYARPEQTVQEWEDELLRALEFSVGHISLYQLTIEQGTQFYTAFNRGDFALPDDDVSADLYERTDDILKYHGFSHYEVSNFAKENHQSRHNLGYWRYEDYIGIGPGAHGRFKDENGVKYATRTHKAPEIYRDLVVSQGSGLKDVEVIDPRDQFIEMMMMGLRLDEGVFKDYIRQETGKNLNDWLDGRFINSLKKESYFVENKEKISMTRQGRMRLNACLSSMMDYIQNKA